MGRLWRIGTGHDLMITEPGAVAAVLMEIAPPGFEYPPATSSSRSD